MNCFLYCTWEKNTSAVRVKQQLYGCSINGTWHWLRFLELNRAQDGIHYTVLILLKMTQQHRQCFTVPVLILTLHWITFILLYKPFSSKVYTAENNIQYGACLLCIVRRRERFRTATTSDYWRSHLSWPRRQRIVHLTKWIPVHGQFFLQFNGCGKKVVCCVNKQEKLTATAYPYICYVRTQKYILTRKCKYCIQRNQLEKIEFFKTKQ